MVMMVYVDIATCIKLWFTTMLCKMFEYPQNWCPSLLSLGKSPSASELALIVGYERRYPRSLLFSQISLLMMAKRFSLMVYRPPRQNKEQWLVAPCNHLNSITRWCFNSRRVSTINLSQESDRCFNRVYKPLRSQSSADIFPSMGHSRWALLRNIMKTCCHLV